MDGDSSLRLEGAPNFRDIGGCVTIDGRRVKRGRIFRSGELSHLTDADLDALRRLGISFVADLRSLKESEVHRSRWPEGMATEWYRADITLNIQVGGRSIYDMFKDDLSPEGTARVVCHSFSQFPEMCGPALKQIVDRLAQGVAPLLFHCTNGRDRTGTISAMLLYMLGAPRDAIVEDFMATNRHIDFEQVVENSIASFRKALGTDVDRRTVELCTLVIPEYIETTFRAMEGRYGSLDGYLHYLGIDEAARDKLRQLLLEPA